MINQESPGKQRERTFEQTVRLRYLLFLPPGYGTHPDEKWPLILFLHGMGERGDDLELVKIHGIPKVVERQPDFPFIVVSPQCPDETMWWDHHLTLKGLLDETVANYAVDGAQHGGIWHVGHGDGLFQAIRSDRTDLWWWPPRVCLSAQGHPGLGLSRCRRRRGQTRSRPTDG